MLRQEEYEMLAEKLWAAYLSGRTVPPISPAFPQMDLDDAYLIQKLTAQKALKSGRRVAGKKIGLTSKALQEMFCISEPDYGHLYDKMIWAAERPISVGALHGPRVEAEIAFILGRDIRGPGVSAADVLYAAAGIAPCFEIISSRIQNWEGGITDSVSDNASSAGVILGPAVRPAGHCDLKNIGVVLRRNGAVTDTGTGEAVMGHPARSVAWLANKLGEHGAALRKGEIILSGSLTKPSPAAAGDVFCAAFDCLGSVKAVFTD